MYSVASSLVIGKPVKYLCVVLEVHQQNTTYCEQHRKTNIKLKICHTRTPLAVNLNKTANRSSPLSPLPWNAVVSTH